MNPPVETHPVDLDAIIKRVREAARDEGIECPTCHGDGRVDGGSKVLHSYAGGFGCDTDAEGVVDDIRKADDVRWIDHWMVHDLQVTVDGRTSVYSVRRPMRDES
jgi:hypothetical protein